MLACVMLGGCETEKRIHGTVRDVFGAPLAGAEVGINDTAYRSVTDDSGSFSIDYAPGRFFLRIGKQGFTTHALEINISEKSDYPLGDIVLLPLPPDPDGAYLIDETAKRLVRLPNLATVERREKSSGWMESDVSFSLRYRDDLVEAQQRGDEVPSELYLSAGNFRFVGAALESHALLRIRSGEGSLLHSFEIGPMGRKDIYLDAPEVVFDRVGTEQILLRSVQLKPGRYAWVPYGKTMMGVSMPIADKDVFPFCVERNFESWLGEWHGPEGTYLTLAGHEGHYEVTISDLEGPRTFRQSELEVSVECEQVSFIRDGKREYIRESSGDETGMKWLAGESNCLTVRVAEEGFCRD